MSDLEVMAYFDCPLCKRAAASRVLVQGGYPETSSVDPAWSAEATAQIRCSNCDKELEAYAHISDSACTLRLEDFPKVPVRVGVSPPSFQEDNPSDWDDVAVPTSPFEVFIDTHRQARQLLGSHGGIYGHHLINRMVFMQLIGAMEAYLGDTLIQTVKGSWYAADQLIAANKDLASLKFSLAEISNHYNFVGNEVGKYLRSVIYHNLPKVEILYRQALGIEIFSNTEAKGFLSRAVRHRHDCVHRNGFGENGKRLNVFTKVYIREVATEIKEMIEHVDAQLNRYVEAEKKRRDKEEIPW